jgi:hypothetical protein
MDKILERLPRGLLIYFPYNNKCKVGLNGYCIFAYEYFIARLG